MLQELAKRIFPLCESYLLIDQFVESRSQFKKGLVNHAFAAAVRALLLVCFMAFSLFTLYLLVIMLSQISAFLSPFRQKEIKKII